MTNIINKPLHQQQNQEITKIKQIIELSDWKLSTQIICSNTGLDINSEATNKETSTATHSPAYLAGHKDIYSFITNPTSGLGMSWEAWCINVKALNLKNKYNIYSESPKEIIDQFNKVEASLKRMPTDAAEFHHHIENLLSNKIANMASEISNSELKNENLSKELSLSKKKIEEQESIHKEQVAKEQRLVANYEDKIKNIKATSKQELESQIASINENYQRDLNELSSRHKAEMAKVRESLEAEIHRLTKLNQDFEVEIVERSEKITILEAEKDRLSQVSNKLIAEFSVNGNEDNNDKINELEDEISNNKYFINNYKKTITEQGDKINSLKKELIRANKAEAKLLKTNNLLRDVTKLQKEKINSTQIEAWVAIICTTSAVALWHFWPALF